MNLLLDRWIPVRMRDGRSSLMAPWEITRQDNVIIDITPSRPDFKGALYQFLIGVFQTFLAVEDIEDWYELWEEPPDTDTLKTKLEPHTDFFRLFNTDGPAFMQDLDLPECEAKQIGSLLIEEPGDKTVRDNLDHFVKRDRIQHMCPCCTAIALFTLQINAPSGGVGHRTGLRGGGPLTSLVKTPMSEATLWQQIWLNVLPVDRFGGFDSNAREQIFPWLAPTRISDKSGAPTFRDEVHDLHIFWAMPRRIRLANPKSVSTPCDVCGQIAELGFTAYRTKNYGYNYGGAWVHPLTPYRFSSDNAKPPLSLKGKIGGLIYADWLGVVLQNSTQGIRAAEVVRHYIEEKWAELNEDASAQLWCFGYDTDNMKVRCWYDHNLPVFRLTHAKREIVRYWIEDGIVAYASHAAKSLRTQVKAALFKEPKHVKSDFNYVAIEFWKETETAFYTLVRRLSELPENLQNMPYSLVDQWLRRIRFTCVQLFDAQTLENSNEAHHMQQVMKARNQLKTSLFTGKPLKQLQKMQSAETEGAR